MTFVIVFWRVDQIFVKAQDCVSQTLEIDDKDTEQISPFISQGKNTMHWLLNKFISCWLTIALLNAGNTTGGFDSFFQILLIPV